jgi:hypothetical protein
MTMTKNNESPNQARTVRSASALQICGTGGRAAQHAAVWTDRKIDRKA